MVPYFQVLIDHSRNATARATAAEMQKTISALTDVNAAVFLDERDWWSRDRVIVSPAVSYSPFSDNDGSKRTQVEGFADRLTALLGTTVHIHETD